MGVFKEEAHILENIERKQKRIYNDSADYGYPYNTDDPPQEVKDVFNVIKEFKEADKKDHKLPFIRNRQTWREGVSLDIVIFWEEDEGYYFGTKYTVSFNKTPRHPSLIDKSCNAFISVFSERYKEKAK